ncbi:MAG: alanine--tRNA ligase, partial [Chloroflexi bacterium]|nr:alanine--tRNA ligase [Chloroflexota bacterium]
EMLGNFSFGDYFKRDAIRFAWEFVTERLKLPREPLWFTIYQDDEEAFALWQEIAGAPPERIIRLGEKDNFWAMGDTGPCGPCSELHYDRGEAFRCQAPVCAVGACDCDRWLEIWNLVFMQYDRDAAGTMTPLPKPSIDTGMGLERIASVVQCVDSNWDTDLLRPIIARVEELAGKPYFPDERGFPFRVIADHARTCAFLITDGVVPSNEWRGYVLRRILRRAVRYGRLLGMEGPFLGQVAEAVIHRMGRVYPELFEKETFVRRVINLEEERFGQTLSNGLGLLQEVIADTQARGALEIPGEQVFRLYDTYGFPVELTAEVAGEQGLGVDLAGFEAAMAQQRERARAAARFAGERTTLRDYAEVDLPPSEFLGYGTLAAEGMVLDLAVDGQPVEAAYEGQQVEVVLDRTPFYAERGGQVGDHGLLMGDYGGTHGVVRVTDTQYAGRDLIVHRGVVAEGAVFAGQRVQAQVDETRRRDTMRNHTATHLLHAALRRVLGGHVQQAGSLVAPDRLRFDFSHVGAPSREELERVQRLVNDVVRRDWPVHVRSASFQEALAEGALAFFDEKYGETVRIIEVHRAGSDGAPLIEGPDTTATAFSKELCGGTHVSHTGEIGACFVISEGSIGAGMRRIEAVTGRGAEELFQSRQSVLESLAQKLQTTPADLPNALSGLLAELDRERRRAQSLQRELARHTVAEVLGQVRQVDGVKVLAAQVPAADADALREMADLVRDRLGSGVIVLGAVYNDRPNFLAMVTRDLAGKRLHAGELVRKVAEVTGGRGGGRPEMAQGGGRDAGKLQEALSKVPEFLGRTED